MDDICDRVSSVDALHSLLGAGADIRGMTSLHAKVYLFDEKHAVVTSANLTESAMISNPEFGLISRSDEIIETCHNYFNGIWEQAGWDKQAGVNLMSENLNLLQQAVEREKSVSDGKRRATGQQKEFGVKIDRISTPSVQAPAVSERAETPWTGNCYFVSVKNIPTHRSWNDMRNYGFIAAGESRKSSRQLDRLTAGDVVYAYLPPKLGYVGFGIVTASSVMARDFKLAGGRSLAEIKPELENDNLLNVERLNDKEKCEYLVAVEWKKAVAEDKAQLPPEPNVIQNIVCKLNPSRAHHAAILNFLAREFGAPGS